MLLQQEEKREKIATLRRKFKDQHRKILATLLAKKKDEEKKVAAVNLFSIFTSIAYGVRYMAAGGR